MKNQAPPSARKLLERGAHELERAGVAESKWEAERLLRHALGWTRDYLIAHSDEPVIARFSRRAPSHWIRNRRVKSIVDPARALRPKNVHYFVYRDSTLAVTETGRPVQLTPRQRFKKRLRPLYRILGPALKHFDPYASTDITDCSVSVDHLRINHYPVKSREEFLCKARFKQEKKRYEGVDYFAYHDRNEVFDPILRRYLPELEKALADLRVSAGYSTS